MHVRATPLSASTPVVVHFQNKLPGKQKVSHGAC